MSRGAPLRAPSRPVAAAVGWVVVAGSAAVVGARLLRLDVTGWLVAAIAGSPWVFLPVAAVGFVGALRRRWLLAVAAVVVLVAPGWWTATQFAPVDRGPAAGPAWPRLRVLDANVTWTNHDMAPVAAQVTRDNPDIVALEEVTPADVAALSAGGRMARYRWHLLAPAGDSAGMALWSDRPLVGATVWQDHGHPELRARVLLPGASVEVLVVHTFIPVELPVGLWKAEMGGLAAAVRGLRGPRLVIGDFNATWDMYEFQRVLTAGGLRDAAVESGRGWEMTWSPVPALPAVLQLDHALIDPGMAVTGYRLGPDPGGQHRTLLVTVAVPAGG